MKINRKMISSVLAASLLLTANGAAVYAENDVKSEKIQAENIQKGRYREAQISFPKEVQKLFCHQVKEDGTVSILAGGEPGSLFLYESGDDGSTWKCKLEVPAGGLPNGYAVKDACLKPDGDIFFSAGKISKEAVYEGEASGELHYYNLKETEGRVSFEEVLLKLPAVDEATLPMGYGLCNLEVSADNLLYGNLLIREGEIAVPSIYCMNLSDGSVRWKRDAQGSGFALYGNKLYFDDARTKNNSSRSGVVLDAETGEQTGELSFPLDMGTMENVSLKPEEERMVYCSDQGIFSTDYSQSFTEKLLNGEDFSISENGYQVNALCAMRDNCFLVFMQDTWREGPVEIYRYEYDKDCPSVPENQITVYSLKQNEIMEKMLLDFRKEHPETAVKLEIGMEETGVETVSEAVENLTERLMEGDGPDLMVLNSLPWESYSEKGMLLDVSAEVSNLIADGEVYEKMFRAYEKDDSWYAVPVSVKVPVVVGEEADVKNIASLESLADAVDKTEKTTLDRADEELIRFISSVYWKDIRTENGSVSREKLGNMLEQIKKINDKQRAEASTGNRDGTDEPEEPYEEIINHVCDAYALDNMLGLTAVKDENEEMVLGYYSDVRNCLENENSGESRVIKPVRTGVFSPLTVGINGQTGNVEAAKTVLEFLLGEKEQGIFAPKAYQQMGNFPVNKKAFQRMTEKPSEDVLHRLGKLNRILGLEYHWPSEQVFEQLDELLDGLSVPAMEDYRILKVLTEYGMPYLNGEKKLDTAVEEIMEKLKADTLL